MENKCEATLNQLVTFLNNTLVAFEETPSNPKAEGMGIAYRDIHRNLVAMCKKNGLALKNLPEKE